MALEDIEKLKERLANNPDSKLFVPLAEEYRKAEMFDEAIEVLKQGLENQPSYMSARVSLGKIYLEKEMFDEALSEFEEVIKTIPDNLFAHKKLAEIYKDRGLNSKARERYETVLRLSPLDDDAQMNLEALEGLPDDIQEEVSAPPAKETVHETEAIEEPAPPAQERPRTEENMEDILREEVSYTDSEEGFYEDELLGKDLREIRFGECRYSAVVGFGQ